MHSYAPSRRAVALRFFFYGILTVLVLVLSAIGILSVLGFQLDTHTGQIEQGALIQLRSQPSNALVTIDKQALSSKTSTRSNVLAGQHSVDMSLDGYRDWHKNVTVSAGDVLWLTYTRLIPTNLKTTNAQSLESLESELPAPNGQWILGVASSTTPSLLLIDLRANQPTSSSVPIPDTTYTKASNGTTGSFFVMSWDSGGRYALIKHTYDSSTEFIRYDRENPSQLRNITTQFNLQGLSSLSFIDGSGDVFDAQVGTDIRKLNISAGTISQPLVSNVLSFTFGENGTLAYTSHDGNEWRAGMYNETNGNVVVRRFTTEPSHFNARYSEYYGLHYLAVSYGNTIELIQSPGISSRLLLTTMTVNNLDWLNFNGGGRFLVAQSGNAFTSYDIETAERHSSTLGPSANATEFKWFDDFHLMTTAGGNLNIAEFDGTNQVTMQKLNEGFLPILSSNGEKVYSVLTNKTSGKPDLQSTDLIVR